MLTMNEIGELRMQQQIAHEIYRQQIMQRLPDPFAALLPPLPGMAHHMILPPRPTLPGAQAKLENDDLWQQFHHIGTEMIITKTGRRMFPSMRISVSGLEEESNYCVLLEMVPIGDCRFKFSGSQWVPAGGAEPQSPQRMFLHPDSPATGAHWQSQAILFNKVKLTNNTLDNSGHVVLASMHKYQPRFHVIRTRDLTQLPWAPQQAFVFPETEFVAVTAYQNDRITKLKIDNNPFAKGFRETGQSRCKRKLTATSGAREERDRRSPHQASPLDDDRCSVASSYEATALTPTPHAKRMRSHGSLDDEGCFSSGNSIGSVSPRADEYALSLVGAPPPPPPPHHQLSAALYQPQPHHHHSHHHSHQPHHHPAMLRHAASLDLAAAAAAAAYFNAAAAAAPHTASVVYAHPAMLQQHQHQHQHQRQHLDQQSHSPVLPYVASNVEAAEAEPEIDISRTPSPAPLVAIAQVPSPTPPLASVGITSDAAPQQRQPTQAKRKNFSISAILAY